MIIDLDDELKLSRFRKIMALIPNSTVIKVLVNGQYYDISKVIDKKDVTIFEVEGIEDSYVVTNPDYLGITYE